MASYNYLAALQYGIWRFYTDLLYLSGSCGYGTRIRFAYSQITPAELFIASSMRLYLLPNIIIVCAMHYEAPIYQYSSIDFCAGIVDLVGSYDDVAVVFVVRCAKYCLAIIMTASSYFSDNRDWRVRPNEPSFL